MNVKLFFKFLKIRKWCPSNGNNVKTTELVKSIIICNDLINESENTYRWSVISMQMVPLHV